jgi:streptogramin lyase
MQYALTLKVLTFAAALALLGPVAIVASTPSASAASLPMSEFPLPTANSFPGSIAAGPDGNLWFTESGANQIGKITPTGTVTEYGTGLPNIGLDGIAAGPDGNVWFTCQLCGGIGNITPSGQVNTQFNDPVNNEDAQGLTTGPDGNVWFADLDNTFIARMTPTGTLTNFPVPGGETWAITAGPDGNLWFTEPNANQIGKITPAGTVTEYPVPSSLGLGAITAGPDGNVWFTEPNANQIGKITPAGTVTEYPIPSGNSPSGIAAGPDGNLWFTEPNANQIGQITPTGQVTEYPGPAPNGSPQGITAGPDGNLWFTDAGANQIVKITLASTTTVTVSSSASPSVTGQPVTYTATVSPVPSPGTVAFSDIGQPIASCAQQPVNSSGNATCTVTYPDPGSHQITASSGGAESQSLPQSVTQASTTTQVTASPNPDNPSTHCGGLCLVTLTAAVSVNAPGAGTPTGTVQFAIDGANYGVPVSLTGGTATEVVIFPRVIVYKNNPEKTILANLHTVTATYSGDQDFSASTAQTTEVVDQKLVCLSIEEAIYVDTQRVNAEQDVLGAAQKALAYLISIGQGDSTGAATLQKEISALQQDISNLQRDISSLQAEQTLAHC